MAGTIVINDHADWLPAGWVYDNVLDAIACELREYDAALADEFLAARTTVSQGYLDLRNLDSDSYRQLLLAAERTLQAIRSAGPDTLALPDSYLGYLAQFETFCDLLVRDPRATVVGPIDVARHAHGG